MHKHTCAWLKMMLNVKEINKDRVSQTLQETQSLPRRRNQANIILENSQSGLKIEEEKRRESPALSGKQAKILQDLSSEN